MAARALGKKSPAEKSSSASRTSMRWCGIPPRSWTGSLSDPTSRPRYTCTESALMTSPPRASARRRERAVLPTAVGPVTMTTFSRFATPRADCAFSQRVRLPASGSVSPSASARQRLDIRRLTRDALENLPTLRDSIAGAGRLDMGLHGTASLVRTLTVRYEQPCNAGDMVWALSERVGDHEKCRETPGYRVRSLRRFQVLAASRRFTNRCTCFALANRLRAPVETRGPPHSVRLFSGIGALRAICGAREESLPDMASDSDEELQIAPSLRQFEVEGEGEGEGASSGLPASLAGLHMGPASRPAHGSIASDSGTEILFDADSREPSRFKQEAMNIVRTPPPAAEEAQPLHNRVGSVTSLRAHRRGRSVANVKLNNMRRTQSYGELRGGTGPDGLPRVKIAVCAMSKKSNSKPMRNILERLRRSGEFEIEVFTDEMILHQPQEQWPECDCLISFFSSGFPLEKAIAYSNRVRPYLINDITSQRDLLDRRKVYQRLKEVGIPVPKHIIVDRDGIPPGEDVPGFIEEEDYVELDGQRLVKPFVEKPVSGEDHNIYIYYPHSMGGGVKKLFRKVANKSAEFDPDHPGTVRRDGSYIYEAFLTTGGTDVKVYTVGPRYAHAEARRSPVVDGKVLRTAEGKEVRFPVLLSPSEKEMARIVSLAFQQKVCGFDLLRSEKGRSYVCDVNGWSFVKSSTKYYDDCAGILRSIILSALAPHRLVLVPSSPGAVSMTPEGRHVSEEGAEGVPEEEVDEEEDDASFEELRCVLAVVRHGDRTPKQKVKVKVMNRLFMDLLHKYMEGKGKQAKLKSPNQMQELLDVTREVVAQLQERKKQGPLDDDTADKLEKLKIVRAVLEQGGHFSGVNRKCQIKPTAWEDAAPGEDPRCREALLIVKHGGVLTHAGRVQTERLGQNYRMTMYPRYGPSGGGLLRLHSTYRHDLKIYSSDEGRVQCSAAAFTKGLLDLEGASLTPILVSLVKKDARMLDVFEKGASMDIRAAKTVLYRRITTDPLSSIAYNIPLPSFNTPNRTPPATSPPLSPTPSTTNIGGALGRSRPDTPHIEPPQESETHQESSATTPAAGSRAKGPSVSMTEASSPVALTSRAMSRVQDSLALLGDGATHGSVPSFSRRVSRHGSERDEDADLGTEIRALPDNSLGLLHDLLEKTKLLVEELHDKCKSSSFTPAEGIKSYSALTQDTKEWVEQEGQPCSGERLLLIYDRWRKLHKALYLPKKGLFDISKIPDIYDMAKYDAVHNSHMGLTRLHDVYGLSKVLANAVVPNEYGITDKQKLSIGSKIAEQLLAKVLTDLDNTKSESVSTAGQEGSAAGMTVEDSRAAHLARRYDEEAIEPPVQVKGEVPEGLSDSEESRGDELESMHRLCPTYADGVNTPLRHVRTRIYFTSESHLHSLVNVLRYVHLGRDDLGDNDRLVSDQARTIMSEEVQELDYLSQVVFCMYENKRVPIDDPRRFRVEILFSPGAAYNPYECKPADHVLPTAGRIPLHPGAGVTLDDLQRLLGPIATSAASPKDKEKESKEKESKEKDRDTREGREREVGSTRASDSGRAKLQRAVTTIIAAHRLRNLAASRSNTPRRSEAQMDEAGEREERKLASVRSAPIDTMDVVRALGVVESAPRDAVEAPRAARGGSEEEMDADALARLPSDRGDQSDGDSEGASPRMTTKDLTAVADRLQAASHDPGLGTGTVPSPQGWGVRSPVRALSERTRSNVEPRDGDEGGPQAPQGPPDLDDWGGDAPEELSPTTKQAHDIAIELQLRLARQHDLHLARTPVRLSRNESGTHVTAPSRTTSQSSPRGASPK